MKEIRARWKSVRILLLVALLVSTACFGIIRGSVLQSNSTPLEVKEPLEILGYPAPISLFPGETQGFSVQVENIASVNYSVALEFHLNDTDYQRQHVVFSSENYTVVPGKQALVAWLSVSAEAPPGNFLLTASVTRQSGEEQPISSPSPEGSLSPSLSLLGGGARWAAGDGISALFVNAKDNWVAHHLTDGVNWGPWWSESSMGQSRSTISRALEQVGFSVDFEGDIPQSLSGYDLVFVEAYWAVEPRHSALFREYVAGGGGVVILGGVPCYFSVYCKDMWPYILGGMDLTSLQDWFGCRYYANAGGTARVAVNTPFDTSLLNSDVLIDGQGGSYAAALSPSNDTQVIALWDEGPIFAFTHEYGQGRVYYQAAIMQLGYDNNWSYRKSHVINSAVGAGTNYQVKVVVHYGSGSDSGGDVYLNSKCKSDFGDIRFTTDDGSTLLDYWMESKIHYDTAVFWVKVSADLSSSNQTIYVYYGNSGAISAGNGTNTFLFFDDFSSDLSKWTQRNGTWSIDSSKYLKTPTTDNDQIATALFTMQDGRIRYYFKQDSVVTWITGVGLSCIARSPNASNFYRVQYWDCTSDTYEMWKYVNSVHTGLNGTAISADANWHTGEFLLYGSALKGYLDDSYELEATDTALTSNSYLGFRYGGLAEKYYLIDWIIVGKYVSPEPSHGAWGQEETAILTL